jgi:DNA-directed RNA polymerase specialized sigma24 family protein
VQQILWGGFIFGKPKTILTGLQQCHHALKEGPIHSAYTGVPSSMSLGQELAPHLPFLRRYARALTGSQTHGDAFVRAALEAIVASPEDFPRDVDPRLGLYRTFHAIWSTANIEEGEEPQAEYAGAEGIAQARLSRITPLSRQALLLTSLEGFSSEDAGYLIGASPSDVESLVAEALAEIERQTLADVLIIEDEPIIAMDIETIVRDLGHNVPAGPGARRHPACGRFERDRRGEGHSRGVFGAGDLHHGVSGAAADRHAAGTDVPDHQAVPALDREGGDRSGTFLRRSDRSCLKRGIKEHCAARRR